MQLSARVSCQTKQNDMLLLVRWLGPEQHMSVQVGSTELRTQNTSYLGKPMYNQTVHSSAYCTP